MRLFCCSTVAQVPDRPAAISFCPLFSVGASRSVDGRRRSSRRNESESSARSCAMDLLAPSEPLDLLLSVQSLVIAGRASIGSEYRGFRSLLAPCVSHVFSSSTTLRSGLTPPLPTLPVNDPFLSRPPRPSGTLRWDALPDESLKSASAAPPSVSDFATRRPDVVAGSSSERRSGTS